MNVDLIVRITAFVGIFAVMAVGEMMASRRQWQTAKVNLPGLASWRCRLSGRLGGIQPGMMNRTKLSPKTKNENSRGLRGHK